MYNVAKKFYSDTFSTLSANAVYVVECLNEDFMSYITIIKLSVSFPFTGQSLAVL